MFWKIASYDFKEAKELRPNGNFDSIMEATHRTKTPEVGVILLNWNGAEDTCRCLDSLRDVRYSNLQIIVVDNGSREGQVEMIQKEHGGIIDKFIQNEENLGYAAGNNIGIQFAVNELGCSFVLILNNDTVLRSDTITELVYGAIEHEAGIVGPKILEMRDNKNKYINSAGGNFHKLIPHHSMRGNGEQDKGQYNEPREVDFVSGACMLVHQDVFKEIGMIPTFYFLQWEDIDFCTQARRAGYKVIYWPHTEIHHGVSTSFKREGKNYSMVIRGYRNRIWFYRRFYPKLKYIHIITISLILTPIHIIYYVYNKYNITYFICFIQGLYLGFTTDIGEGPDPDNEFQEVAQKAKETPTEL